MIKFLLLLSEILLSTKFIVWASAVCFLWFGFFDMPLMHINLCGLFNAKTILVEKLWYYLIHS